MAASDFGNDRSVSDQAKDAAGSVRAAAQDLGRQAASTAGEYRDKAADAADKVGDTLKSQADDLRDTAKDTADTVKEHAGRYADQAQSLVSNFASEARAKVADIVDDQKNRGADQLTSFSRAAQSAAGELEEQSPGVARLVRDAASTVDTLADDLRSADLRDVLSSVSDFARRQPIAFFAASVLAGFALARFMKSEPTGGPQVRSTYRS